MWINMSLEVTITQDIKLAMLAKDRLKLEVCRSIKSSILLAKTEKGVGVITEQRGIDILQKLLKQRRESEKIFLEQNRKDLASHEKKQADVISLYLPTPYTYEELEILIDDIIRTLDINSMSDMGALISETLNKSKGRASGKMVSDIVKQKLS
jgi:uncharacterized protein YqeY